MSITRRLVVTIGFWTIATAAAPAQTPQPVPTGSSQTEAAPPNAFGAATTITTIPVAAMSPTAGGAYLQNNKLHRSAVGGATSFYGSLDVPTGSLVTSFTLEACDSNAAMSVGATLHRCAAPGSADCTVMATIGTPLIGTPGCTVLTAPSITNPTIDNLNFRYVVVVQITGSDTSVTAGGVRVGWQRQVSPTPGTATFNDVPVGHPLHRFVEALAASGITGGCGGGNYCPESPLNRGQMAVFLAVALGLHWPN